MTIISHHIFKAVMLTTVLCQEPNDLIFGGPSLPPRNILRKYFIPFVYHRVVLLPNILYIFFMTVFSGVKLAKVHDILRSFVSKRNVFS